MLWTYIRDGVRLKTLKMAKVAKLPMHLPKKESLTTLLLSVDGRVYTSGGSGCFAPSMQLSASYFAFTSPYSRQQPIPSMRLGVPFICIFLFVFYFKDILCCSHRDVRNPETYIRFD